jgi:hypothetical protein
VGVADPRPLSRNPGVTEDRILTGADLTADLIGYAGPLGATFSISYGVTRAVDEGIGWASREYLGTDLAPTSVMADGMVTVDQALTSLWVDPSRPAYTQTIGWKLAWTPLVMSRIAQLV